MSVKAARGDASPFWAAPYVTWVLLLFLAPLLLIACFAFLGRGLYGGVVAQFSLEAWKTLAENAVLRTVGTTLWIAGLASALTVLLALPAAWAIARSPRKNLWLFLVIIPFWTNFLLRIYAWIAILGNNGMVNQTLLDLHLVPEPLQLLYNPAAVIIVLVYTYLPYAILPLYAAFERFDLSLLEAARDLGATPLGAVRRVLLPGVRGGVTAAILFTFIPSLGQYAIPQLVGGRDSFLLGNLIARELTVNRNWPLASSLSLLLAGATVLGVLLFLRFSRSGAPPSGALE